MIIFWLTLGGALSLSLPTSATINIDTNAVQKSVVFLYAADAQGNVDRNKPSGTGFLVSVPLKSDHTRSYVVLVTARHMVDPSWAKCPASNPTVILYAAK
jgi:hypothetical protein